MSRRVSGVSGRLSGGSEYSASRTEAGSKYSRWVSRTAGSREVLLAYQCRPVARLAQRVDDVVRVVVELEAAVGQAHHSVRVGVLPRQQRGPAARARRRGAEGLAEQQPLVGEALDV